MKLSFLDRGARLKRDVSPYVAGLTLKEIKTLTGRDGESIIKLSSNENPIGPPPSAIRAIHASASTAHYYPHSDAVELRQAIGEYVGVDSSQVVVGSGSSSLMHGLVTAFTGPGGKVLVMSPSFPVYAEIAAIHDRSVIVVPQSSPDFSLEVDTVLSELSPSVELIFITRPNNPTSVLAPLESFRKIAEAAEELGALVVSDEAYVEFADDVDVETAVRLLRPSSQGLPNVVVTRTFSKAFGLANLRVGYAVSSEEIAGSLQLANTKWPTGEIAQAAAVAALRDSDHLNRTREVVKEGRNLLVHGLQELGLEIVPNPQGNFLMANVAVAGWSARRLEERLLMERGILIRGDFSDEFVRISIGTADQNRKLLDAMADFKSPREL